MPRRVPDQAATALALPSSQRGATIPTIQEKEFLVLHDQIMSLGGFHFNSGLLNESKRCFFLHGIFARGTVFALFLPALNFILDHSPEVSIDIPVARLRFQCLINISRLQQSPVGDGCC